MFENVDAVVLLSEVNRFYFTKISTSNGCVILTDKKKVFITDFRYIEVAKKSLPDWNVLMTSESVLKLASEYLKDRNIKKVGFEDTFINVASFNRMKELFEGIELVAYSNELAQMRAIKTEDEISKIAASQVVAQKALSKVIYSIKAGVTEREIAAEILYQMQMLGADGMSFEPIVAFKENSAMPHYKPANRKLEKNDIILIDMGAKMNGYCSDMTRTFSIGDVGTKLEELHALVLEAQNSAIKQIKAGMTAKEADSIAREFFKANGYEKEFGHSLGHGVGLDIHEFPSLSPKSEDILKTNMVVTIEPGLYIEGLGGVRIEDMIVIKENTSLNLTKMSKELY